MTQLPLAIDWHDVDHNATWREDPDLDPDPRLHDLRGQGLTARQLHTIKDIEPRGDYL
ncbi:hypothetical protein [Streptomyces sp. LN704]|uniref:hypothetical protein n=1 Tax=Streptomyces sp. LN704 TaxID=3112982 RepID=UPI0037115BC3